MCCKGVAQRMRMNRFRDASLPGRVHTSLKNAIGSDGAIRLFAWKHPFGRTFPTPVGREHLPERLSQHHLSVLAALPAANPDDAWLAIEVGDPQFGLPRRGARRRTSWPASPDA